MNSLHAPTLIAIIDLGTNSVRLDIHEILEDRTTKLVFREKWMVRLGQNVFITGQLYPDAMERTLLVFEKFSSLFKRANITSIHAYATSALREAKNKRYFLREVKRRTGIMLRILSAKQEAALIAKAITKREKMPPSSALIDIGGGSTEISICKGKKVLRSKSLPLGAARLQQVFLQQIPPVEGSILSMRKHIQYLLRKYYPLPKKAAQIFIGSSGTVKGAYKILQKRKKNSDFRLPELREINLKMSLMTKGELLQIPNMETKRTDLILAGSILLEECMKYFKIYKVRYTNTALRDGILDSILNKSFAYVPHKSPSITDLTGELSGRVGKNYPFAEQLQLAKHIFRFLGRGHGIPNIWKDCFFKASMVYRLGESVSLFDVGSHSVYLLNNLSFPVFTPQQARLGYLLCKWHEKEEIEKVDLKNEGITELSPVFFKILSLLQIHFAFIKSFDHEDLKINFVKQRRGITALEIIKKTPTILLLQIEQHKKLYEKAFKTTLIASSR